MSFSQDLTSSPMDKSQSLASWVIEKRNWLGLEIQFCYPSYLSCWWIVEKSEHFFNILNDEKIQHQNFYQDWDQVPKEIQNFILLIKKFENIKIKKTFVIENRAHLLIYAEKNSNKLELVFFTRHFSFEKTLMEFFATNNNVDDAFQNCIFQIQHYANALVLANDVSELELLTHQYQLPNLLNEHCSPVADKDISAELSLRAHAYGVNLLSLVKNYKPTWFEKFSDFGLSLVSEYSALRLHLLKFLAILPCLDHDHDGHEVKRLFLESLSLLTAEIKKDLRRLPWYITLFLPVALIISKIIPANLLSAILRFSAKLMAARFIAGENIQSSLQTLAELNLTKRDATLDQLGELVLGQEEADHYLNKVLEIIHGLKKHYPHGERNAAGILKAHISLKTTALGEQLKPHAFDDCYQKIAPRLIKILRAAKEANVFVNIDAEHYHFRDLVWRVYSKVLFENRDLYFWKDTGIVVQAYLVDAAAHLQEIFAFQFDRKVVMPIRLVKGAYWDAETIEARAHHFSPPQFLNKIETDLHFRQLAYKLMSNPYTQLVVASHNVLDHCWAESLRTTLFPQTPVIEHQCLHMTYEALSLSLAQMGFVVRNYMPVGNLLVGMAYLVRRIMENSSQVGVLKMMRMHAALSAEQNILQEWQTAKKTWCENPLDQWSKEGFYNHSPWRPYIDKNFHMSQEIGKTIDQTELTKVNPTDPLKVQPQMEQLHQTWCESSWRKNTLERCFVLLQSAEFMVIWRDEISALIVKEAAKTKTEAYADVDEAIDFVNFYVRNFLEKKLFDKKNPLGVVAAITPWNFPFAIPAGMVVAPLLAGNAVVLKSAEQTPQIAQSLVSLLWHAGVPKEILKHFIGLGETVGHAVTTSKDLHGLVFTGSVAVGKMLYQNLAAMIVRNNLEQSFIRPVITEMGGKNAIIVTQNAELDETISGILYSAFAHAGQKCSACSRIIVEKQIMPIFRKRLVTSIASLKVGDPRDPSVLINPVITSEDKTRLIEFKKEAVNDALNHGGKVLIDRQNDFSDSRTLGPVVIEISKKRAMEKESYAQKEAFGPIIHLIEVDNLEEALTVANATNYALTAGLYAQSQTDISTFMQKIQSGNVYVNRPNTGARVGIEPFGGFKLSGTGPKAGGRYYVESFMVNAQHFVDIEKEKVLPLAITEARPELFYLPKPISNFNQCVEAALSLYKKILTETQTPFTANDEKLFAPHFNFYQNNLEVVDQTPNTLCPGQQSFSMWNQPRDLILFWHMGEKLNLSDHAFLVHALANGLRMLVIVEHMPAYHYWKNLLDQLVVSGYPANSIVIWIGSFDVVKMEIKKLPNIDMVYIATESKNAFSKLHHQLMPILSMTKQLPSVLSTYSALTQEEPLKLKRMFFHERAFAINVMRHGAPLE